MTKKNGKHNNNREIMLAGASLAIGLFSWYSSNQQKKKHNKLIKNLSTFKEHASGITHRPMWVDGQRTGNFIQWVGEYNNKLGKGILSEFSHLIYDSTIIVLKEKTYFNESGSTSSGTKKWLVSRIDSLPSVDDTDENRPYYYMITYKEDLTRSVIAHNANGKKINKYSFDYYLMEEDVKRSVTYTNSNKLKD